MLTYLKSRPRLKKLALWTLRPSNDPRPRLWVRLLIPLLHERGRSSIIRNRARIDVFPFNRFKLGTKSMVEDFATINNGVGDVWIGDNTIIGLGCTVIGPVAIGNHVMLAQHIVISGLNHGYEDVLIPPHEQEVICKQITVSDNVWIGANSVITSGVTIGRHSIIGAGSVVTKDIPAFSVAVGNPAKVIKRFNTERNAWERV